MILQLAFVHIHLLFPESILPVHAAEPLRLFMFLYYVFNMYQKLNTITGKNLLFML